MENLIEKLKKATEPSRVLDAEIAVAVGYDLPEPMGPMTPYLKMWEPTEDNEGVGHYWLHQMSGKSLRTAPKFTASIDAAMLLREHKMYVDVSIQGSGYVFAYASIEPNHTEKQLVSRRAPAALPLCEAILRAIHAARIAAVSTPRVITAEDLGVAA